MRIEAIEELRCPTCLGELGLKTFTDSESGGETYVETGVLLCDSCKIEYPIEAYTPVLLRFSTEFHDWFAREHAAALTEFSGYSMPNANPRPGETAVQETFTDEWNLTTEDELSFSYTAEQLVDLNRKVGCAGLPSRRRRTARGECWTPGVALAWRPRPFASAPARSRPSESISTSRSCRVARHSGGSRTCILWSRLCTTCPSRGSPLTWSIARAS